MSWFTEAKKEFPNLLVKAESYFDHNAKCSDNPFRVQTVGNLISALREHFDNLPDSAPEIDDFDEWLQTYGMRSLSESENALIESVYDARSELSKMGNSNTPFLKGDATDAKKTHPRYREVSRLMDMTTEERKALGLSPAEWEALHDEWESLNTLASAADKLYNVSREIARSWDSHAGEVAAYHLFFAGEDFGFLLGMKFISDLTLNPAKFGQTPATANALLVNLMQDSTYRADFIGQLVNPEPTEEDPSVAMLTRVADSLVAEGKHLLADDIYGVVLRLKGGAVNV